MTKYPIYRVTVRRSDRRAFDPFYISGASTKAEAEAFVRLMLKDKLVSVHSVTQTKDP